MKRPKVSVLSPWTIFRTIVGVPDESGVLSKYTSLMRITKDNLNSLHSRIITYDTYKKYHEKRKGILGSGAVFGIFLPITEESRQNDFPEIQIFGLPHLASSPDYKNIFNFDEDYWTNFHQPGLEGKDGYSYFNCLLQPKSRY